MSDRIATPPPPEMVLSDIATAREVLGVEAEALRRLAEGLDTGFSEAVERLLAARGRVICAGIGKSGHVARKIAATFSSTGAAAYFLHPAEASHGDLGMIQGDDVVLALSRSGETAELDDIVQYTKRFGVPLIAMTAKAQSALARAADALLIIPDAPEACAETNAPTTSTTMMMALGDALAVTLLRRRGFDASRFKLYHPGGRLGAMLKTAGDIMRRGDDRPLILAGASLRAAIDEISAKGIGCVGVIDESGTLVGMLTDGDLRRVIARGDAPTTVDDAMTRTPFVVAPETLAASVLADMNTRKITQIFVVAAGLPVGVVHMHDILKAGIA